MAAKAEISQADSRVLGFWLGGPPDSWLVFRTLCCILSQGITRGFNPTQGCPQIFEQQVIRTPDRLWSSDQNIVAIRSRFRRHNFCRCCLQTPPRAVAQNSITDLTTGGKTHPHAGRQIFISRSDLQNKAGGGPFETEPCNPQEFRSFLQARKRPRHTDTLSRQALATLGPTRGDDIAPPHSGHTGTKAMPTLTDKLARLKSAFHDTLLRRRLKT
jgi:hypothetical protein